MTTCLFVSNAEKWAVERELESARQDLDAIEAAREVAERKLQSVMRKCGIRRLPSASGRSITADESVEEDRIKAESDDVDGDATFDDDL